MSNQLIRVGIFFGGQSREREISFAGGRTVYDNLDKTLFEPIPIFVDSLGNLILLEWEYLYKGTIRDFYPPSAFYTSSQYQIYVESLAENTDIGAVISHVGKQVHAHQLAQMMDVAFLALHGPYGEDGTIQGLLEWYGIPYTGSGIMPSSIGISKTIQSALLKEMGFEKLSFTTLNKQVWLSSSPDETFEKIKSAIGFPFVLKAPNQGSSIGVQIIKHDDIKAFSSAVDKCLFIERININWWHTLPLTAKENQIRKWLDIREAIGLPVMAYTSIEAYNLNEAGLLITTPDGLMTWLNAQQPEQIVLLESVNSEYEVLAESFIEGREFSCIVVQDMDGEPIALPPTQIVKSATIFDYRSKYLPGMVRKVTPIDAPDDHIRSIISKCKALFKAFHFNVYARLDGFLTAEGQVFLNDPNTTSGMLPSSFFFHQAAEIGLNPSEFLSYIIYTSLKERLKSGKFLLTARKLLKQLAQKLNEKHSTNTTKKRIAVIMGGYSSERHISVESGRNIFEKLSSSTKYTPIPIFLTGSNKQHELYQIPVNIMLKDNADDILEKIKSGGEKHPLVHKIMDEAKAITTLFATSTLNKPKRISYEDLAQLADGVFIALHGRPGEDGSLQKELLAYNLPFNGSGVESSKITINKYETNAILREHGVAVADHMLVYKSEFANNPEAQIEIIEQRFPYPFIAKPADDGCSSAVKKIKNRSQLLAFTKLMFDLSPEQEADWRAVLDLKPSEEFPQKDCYLIETLIQKGDAVHFLEITGGLLTHYDDEGNIVYEVFEPSETLATGEVLSLEEKFLAGEGQNITPARFDPNPARQKEISALVKAELEKTARILNIEGYCRIDAFVHVFKDGSVRLTVIEINSLPGMTPATCIFHQAAIQHYKPYDFIDKILEFGMLRTNKNLVH
jgi:D-alanine-D-alanine ligase